MGTEELREPHPPQTNGATGAGHQRFRLLATMVQGTASALPEAWQRYRNVEDARSGAREMMRNHRVLRVAIVEDSIPPQFVEWIGR
jgi:hypothetical protein